jgi:hypothetical protein
MRLVLSLVSCCLAACCLGRGLTLAQAMPAAKPRVRPVQPRPIKLPAMRRRQLSAGWVLEGSQPLVAITLYRTVYGRHHTGGDALWGRITLRGPHGSTRVISSPNSFYTLYGASINQQHDVIQVAEWADMHQLLAKARAHPRTPLALSEDDFGFVTWDCRYDTPAAYLAADLNLLPSQLANFDFREDPRYPNSYDLGREDNDPIARDDMVGPYHLLPYWIAQERTHLARTHHLPTPSRLTAYLDLSRDTTTDGRLQRPYRPLLVQLLRAYQAYPLPSATAGRLQQALRALAPPPTRR